MNRERLEELTAAISRAVSQLPADIVDRIASSMLLGAGSNSVFDPCRFSTQPQTRRLLSDLHQNWLDATGLDDRAFAAALLAAKKAHDECEESEKVEIVWTGPATSAIPVRRTEQVLKQLIDNAREDLLLVSFATYKIGDLKTALRAAIDRGVMIKMVLESESSSSGKVGYDEIEAIKKEFSEIAIFIWPSDKRPTDDKGRHGSLHAKCAVADSRVALVSSANLTPFALELNMELGLSISGGEIARRISQHFYSLIDSGILIGL